MNVENEIKEMRKWQETHQKQDDEIYGELRSFIKRSEPMLKVFSDNEIYQIEFKQKTGTIIFYAKAILTIGGVLALAWTLISKIK